MTLQTELLEQERLLVQIEEERRYRQRLDPLKYHKLMPMQERFKADPANIKGLFGGNRSGKSEGGADCTLDVGLNHDALRIWVCGETFQDSIAIQQRKIWSLAPKRRIKYGFYDEVNGFANRKLLFDNGTIITFKSYDQGVEAFASDDIDFIWNDEEPPYQIFVEQRMRLIDRNGKMIFTMTSTHGLTELLSDIFEDGDVIEAQHAELVDETLPRVVEKNGIRFYMLWTTENKHVNQARVVEEAKLLTRQECRSRIYGIPTNLSGKIYPGFNKRVHVVEMDDVPDGRWTLWNVLDPHDRKPWAIGWYAIHHTGTAYQVDEYPNRDFNEMLSDDKTYDDYAVLIKQKEEDLKEIFGVSVSKRIIDPNFGNKTVQLAERQGGQSKTTPRKELEKRGLKYIDGIDALEAGHLKVREFLAWKEKDGQITYQPRFFVVSHCHNTITHLSRYARKDIEGADGDVKDRVAPMDKYKDFCDLTRYFCMANPRFIVPQEFKPDTRKAY